MARYASFCLNGPVSGEVPDFARLWPIRVSFMTGAVRSLILATAGLHVLNVHAENGDIYAEGQNIK